VSRRLPNAAGLSTVAVPRGRYFTPRLLRRLVQERRIPFSRAGRCIVIAEADIENYLERNRVEPRRWQMV
jgi:hypothetical protein